METGRHVERLKGTNVVKSVDKEGGRDRFWELKSLKMDFHSPANAGDAGSIPGSGRSPGVRNGNPLQYSCLENSMDRGAWQAAVYGVTESQTQLSDCVCT